MFELPLQLACKRRRVSGCHLSPILRVSYFRRRKSDSRKYVYIRSLPYSLFGYNEAKLLPLYAEENVTSISLHEYKSKLSMFFLRLGAHRRVHTVGTEQDIVVSKVITHPSYHQPTKYSHDIALLKLEKPAQLDRYLRRASLGKIAASPFLKQSPAEMGGGKYPASSGLPNVSSKKNGVLCAIQRFIY